MATIQNISARTTSLMVSDRLLSALRKTQKGLLDAQTQLTTGKLVDNPSDAPSKTSAILLLQSRLEIRQQHKNTLDHASAMLDNVDQALGDASDLLMEAKSIAMSQIGVGADSETRKNQATVIDAMIQSLVEIANRQYSGVSLFGGNVAAENDRPFIEDLGGVRYVGSRNDLAGDVGLDEALAFNVNGQDAFKALSSRVESAIDLDPQATADTRLADLNGALGRGIRQGTLTVSIDGTEVNVDLTQAQTMGDVITRIQAAIDSVDAAAGSIDLAGPGFELTAAVGHTIAIADIGNGKTAADLGIALSATDGTATGQDVDPRLTFRTQLDAFGASVDWMGGLQITQGNQTKVADFSSAQTVQDLINVINELDLGLRMEINADQTSINLISEVSGIQFAIGENAGGSTATDMGLRTFTYETLLSDLNFGLGVTPTDETADNDFAVALHDGRQFEVKLAGATTVGDVIDRIRQAAEDQGLSAGDIGQVGTDVNIGLSPDGNGLVIEDLTAGGSDFRVIQLGTSLAATHLGIYHNAGSASSIQGEDVAMVQAESVFTHLIALRDALVNNDSRGITLAGERIEGDLQNLTRVQADVGVRAKRVTQQLERSEDLKLTEKTMLESLEGADTTEVITRFAQLQQQLEASLRAGAVNMQMSLLDFLG